MLTVLLILTFSLMLVLQRAARKRQRRRLLVVASRLESGGERLEELEFAAQKLGVAEPEPELLILKEAEIVRVRRCSGCGGRVDDSDEAWRAHCMRSDKEDDEGEGTLEGEGSGGCLSAEFEVVTEEEYEQAVVKAEQELQQQAEVERQLAAGQGAQNWQDHRSQSLSSQVAAAVSPEDEAETGIAFFDEPPPRVSSITGAAPVRFVRT